VPDELCADPRLVRIYDHFDGPRDDLALYVGLIDVRDAPDRPGLEWVYLARRR
jgi:hypothetical protein